MRGHADRAGYAARIARRAAAAALAALAAAGAAPGAPAAAKPERIVSTNLCSDQLVLALAERSRIASLSHLVADPDVSAVADRVDGILLNHGLAEEVLPLDPDLVVAGRYTSPVTLSLLRGLGYPVLRLAIADSLADIGARLRELGAALGEEARAEAVIAAMEARLDRVPAPAGTVRPTALYYQPNGYVAGSGSLVDDVIARAGLTNLGARRAAAGLAYLPLEALVAAPPDILIVDSSYAGAPALAFQVLRHPALAALGSRARRVAMPNNLWICGTPDTVAAVERLAALRRQAVSGQDGGRR